MLLKNPTDIIVTVPELGISVAPGGVVDVKDGYCRPRSSPNQAKLKSVIEMLAPQLVPADAKLVAAWKARTLDLEAPTPAGPSTADLQAQGMPPAMAALVAEGKADSVTKANKSIPVQPKAASKPE